jgi:hypothetical protein
MTDNEELRAQLKALYNTYRTSYMNKKYYGYRLNTVQRWTTVTEIVIAVGTSSSLGGMALLQSGILKDAWGLYSVIVAILAIVKPVLQLNKQVERYSRLFTGHGSLFFDLDLLVTEVAQKKRFTPEIESSYQKAMQRFKELATDDDLDTNDRLLQRCFEETNNDLPADNLWFPSKSPVRKPIRKASSGGG